MSSLFASSSATLAAETTVAEREPLDDLRSALEISDRLLQRHRDERLAMSNRLQPDPDRPFRRIYCGTLVRCTVHGIAPLNGCKCRVRSKRFCAIGAHPYWVEGAIGSARDTRRDCLETAALAAIQAKNETLATRMMRRLADGRDVLDLTIDDQEPAAIVEASQASAESTTTSVFASSLSVFSTDECLAEPVDIFADVLDKSLLLTRRVQPISTSADNSDDEESVELREMRAALGVGRWVCYVLQSTVNPKRTYVGVTNDRFRRLRMHNGEITGGAKMTRSDRPWRMVFLVFGFADKIAALQFEWSMHNPRKRRLKTPFYGVDGRRNCVRQLLKTSAWVSLGLRFAALPLETPIDAHCLAHIRADAIVTDARNSSSRQQSFVCEP